MKTRNLTQNSPLNDPINRWMHGFSFRDFEYEDGVQDVISPYPLDQFSISNTPRMWKRVKKGKKLIDSWIVVSRQFDFSWKSKGVFSVAKNISFIEEKRRNCWMRWFIAINGQDCTSFDESTRLSRVHSIGDGVSTVSHVAHVKRCLNLIHPLDLYPTIAISWWVHRSRLISTVIILEMDGGDLIGSKASLKDDLRHMVD